MSILVVGSVALDDVETQAGRRIRTLGGACTYFSTAASLYDQVSMVGVVGADFPQEDCRNRMREIYYADIAENGIPIKPGLPGLLDFLETESIKIAIATSTAREFTIPKLALTGLDSYFKIIV